MAENSTMQSDKKYKTCILTSIECKKLSEIVLR